MITPGPIRNVAPAPTANPIAIRSRFHERLGASVNLVRALSIRYAPRPPMIQAAGPTRASTNSRGSTVMRSEEHTSELQSQSNLVCRLLLEKKKQASHVHSMRYALL